MWKFDPARADALLSEERQQRLAPDGVLDRLPLQPTQSVADVGCGPGMFTIPLAQRVPRGVVYALDTQEAMLARVRVRVAEHGLSNVVVAQNTEASLPLSPESMDGMFLAFVLHEAAEDRVSFLDVLARHTKPGGWLAVLDWHRMETPYGPPLEIRLEPDEVAGLLRQSIWEPVGPSETLGDWHHFTLARRR